MLVPQLPFIPTRPKPVKWHTPPSLGRGLVQRICSLDQGSALGIGTTLNGQGEKVRQVCLSLNLSNGLCTKN